MKFLIAQLPPFTCYFILKHNLLIVDFWPLLTIFIVYFMSVFNEPFYITDTI
jgi:hypothetical protein